MTSSNLQLPSPTQAFCNCIVRVTKPPFTGQVILDTAYLLENRSVSDLFLYDLNHFESEPTANFVLSMNSDIMHYKSFINLFGLKVNLYTTEEIKHITLKKLHFDNYGLNDRWKMKHRGLITTPFSFKKIILYTHSVKKDFCIYEYENIDSWVNEGFVFIDTTTTSTEMLINIVAGADEVVCGSDVDLFYTLYCKQGCTVYFIAEEYHHPRHIFTINTHYKTKQSIFNIKLLLRENTLAEYKKITSNV
jgi:hypothetical protein